MLRIEILRVLLNGYVCQVTFHVVLLFQSIRVLFITESGEAKMGEPDFERAIARNKDIYSQIELFLSDQKRLIYVPADDIGLRIALSLERQLAGVSPFLNLLQLVH